MTTQIALTVTDVTVFPDRARVTCRGSAELGPGAHVLTVADLPLALEPESLRARGRAAVAARLMGVDVVRVHYAETPAAQVQALEEEIDALIYQRQSLQDGIAGQEAYGEYLAGMRRATELYARGLAFGRTTVEEQAALQAHLLQEDQARRAQIRDLAVSVRNLERELEQRRKQLAALQSMRPRQRYQATVQVELGEAGELELELSYVVRQAGWKPLYDARLARGEEGWQLTISALAEVHQRTGQDWTNVNLTYSTARPALNQRLPEVKPWHVDALRPRPAAQARLADAPAPAASKDFLTAAAVVPPVVEEVAATVDASGLAVTFRALGGADVPSDGTTRKSLLANYELDPELDYLAAPRHTQAVFRRITVRNTAPGPLLAGPVNLFVDDAFIGVNQLAYVPRGDTFELMLGAEDQITVTRELVRRDVDKRLLRDRRQLGFGYEVKLENLKSDEATIELIDQIPLSLNEAIQVKLADATPPPDERSELNVMTWHVTLASGENWQLRYDFSVEHPREMAVVGLPVQ